MHAYLKILLGCQFLDNFTRWVLEPPIVHPSEEAGPCVKHLGRKSVGVAKHRSRLIQIVATAQHHEGVEVVVVWVICQAGTPLLDNIQKEEVLSTET